MLCKKKHQELKPASPSPAEEDSQEGDENKIRGNWTNRMDFMLSVIGYAVGLGNVWRFPYLCYRNGGGAFLVPYLMMLCLAGFPLFIMEVGHGQFASKGCIGAWSIAPIFKGIGYSMCCVTILCCIYYNVIIGYTIFYFYSSFTTEVPWRTCNNTWNTESCMTSNFTEDATRPSAEFWNNMVLARSEGLHEMGPIRWQNLVCLIIAWIIVFVCISKGVKSSGKVVYFTATFPYVVLIILLIRGVTLPGSLQGILFYIRPDFSRLADANVWKDGAVQIFYSLGPAWGGLHTMASYNKFHNNFYRDSLILAGVNCGTSILAGFVIFSVIGFMAEDMQLPLANVTDNGPGLAFVAYPEALARMPIAPLWSVLFFFMLFTLGLDSQFVMMETVITAVCDELQSFFPRIFKFKTWITLITCFICFLLALPMVTNGGIYIFSLMETYSAGFSILTIGFVECVVIAYVYGSKRFLKDMKVMLGFQLNIYWRICWMLLSPAIITFIFIFWAITYTSLTYYEYTYPLWAECLGWLMIMAGVVFMPAYAIYYMIIYGKGTIQERFAQGLRPEESWGPALDKHRLEAGYPLLAPGDDLVSTKKVNGGSYEMVASVDTSVKVTEPV
ncbi:sodium- and chloride-dependent glycine transporter 1-like [Acanthaster planci]|uniref:Transporter n=1 Tax=Acanthaster planci TaxID=133434 RepID=A0A8B7Y2R8_ACAPL|nr:sodium- and chloride-dependent glycine transporter 1-like [Acanthaster planci]